MVVTVEDTAANKAVVDMVVDKVAMAAAVVVSASWLASLWLPTVLCRAL